mmetsp:Transcript_26951/g.72668  ORF Transcript_26951/g.72668 Transcript_26951/m.72668 type:complete len:212 (+) Transcript_26951:1249-1884(+)
MVASVAPGGSKSLQDSSAPRPVRLGVAPIAPAPPAAAGAAASVGTCACGVSPDSNSSLRLCTACLRRRSASLSAGEGARLGARCVGWMESELTSRPGLMNELSTKGVCLIIGVGTGGGPASAAPGKASIAAHPWVSFSSWKCTARGLALVWEASLSPLAATPAGWMSWARGVGNAAWTALGRMRGVRLSAKLVKGEISTRSSASLERPTES